MDTLNQINFKFMICKKCKQDISYGAAHRKSCSPNLNPLTNGITEAAKGLNNPDTSPNSASKITTGTVINILANEVTPTDKSTELNQILDSLWKEIMDGHERSVILSFKNSLLPINEILKEIAAKITDGNDKAKVLKYVR